MSTRGLAVGHLSPVNFFLGWLESEAMCNSSL